MAQTIGTGTITLEDAGGRDLRVATWRLDEPSELPPVLFFNGLGANLEAIAPLAEHLCDRPFITMDMPGVGASPEPLLPYSFASLSWNIAILLDRLGVDKVDLMGFSWGGMLAQQFALQHSRHVRRLVLCATTAGMLMMPGTPAAMAKLFNSRSYYDPAFMNEHFQTLHTGVDPDCMEHKDEIPESRLVPPSPRGFLYQMAALFGWTSAPALPFIKQPTLVLSGSEDRLIVPMNGRILSSLIRDAKLVEIEGGGHLFLLTHSSESLAAIRDFLGGCETASQAKAA